MTGTGACLSLPTPIEPVSSAVPISLHDDRRSVEFTVFELFTQVFERTLIKSPGTKQDIY